jgi:hypothetical protein
MLAMRSICAGVNRGNICSRRSAYGWVTVTPVTPILALEERGVRAEVLECAQRGGVGSTPPVAARA